MVHQYKLNGYNIVLDSCSASIHSVDEVAYDIIEMYPHHSREEIVEHILTKYATFWWEKSHLFYGPNVNPPILPNRGILD